MRAQPPTKGFFGLLALRLVGASVERTGSREAKRQADKTVGKVRALRCAPPRRGRRTPSRQAVQKKTF